MPRPCPGVAGAGPGFGGPERLPGTRRRPPPPPGFPMSVPAGHHAGKRRDRPRRPCGDPAGHGSRFRRYPDRPIQYRPSHTVSRLSCRHPPTDAATPPPAGPRRSARRFRQRPAACPTGRTGGRPPPREHIPFRPAGFFPMDAAPQRRSAATRRNGTSAPVARPIIESAMAGLVANPVPSGTCAPARRAGSSAHAFGGHSPRAVRAWPWRGTREAKTPARQLVALPADPAHCRATPHDIPPFSENRSRPDPASRPRRPASRGLFAHGVAQRIGVPAPPPGNRLPPPRPRIPGRPDPHPAGLAPFITKQTARKMSRRDRRPPLPGQGTDPRLVSRSEEVRSSSVVPVDATVIDRIPNKKSSVGEHTEAI